MMGTSLLTMPWALQQSGFALGIALMFIFAAMMLYTCSLVLRHGNGGWSSWRTG